MTNVSKEAKDRLDAQVPKINLFNLDGSYNTIAVNLFGAPGAKKSTMAAGLYYYMKTKNYNVELVREYAKDLAWAGTLANASQQEIFEEQKRRMDIVNGKVALVINDSPLLNSLYYGDNKSPLFIGKVRSASRAFYNMNYFVSRVAPFREEGRLQNEQESDSMVGEIKSMLKHYDVYYLEVPGNSIGLHAILSEIYYVLEKSNIPRVGE
jgi:hypothetical protein